MPTYVPNSSCPAVKAQSVTPSDTVELSGYSRSLYIGGAGNVSAILDGQTILFSGLAAGSILPIRTNKVLATNTTATLIVALY